MKNKKWMLIMAAMSLMSCTPKGASEASFGIIESVEHKGHTYVIYDGHNAGGIIHSHACKCLNK